MHNTRVSVCHCVVPQQWSSYVITHCFLVFFMPGGLAGAASTFHTWHCRRTLSVASLHGCVWSDSRINIAWEVGICGLKTNLCFTAFRSQWQCVCLFLSRCVKKNKPKNAHSPSSWTEGDSVLTVAWNDLIVRLQWRQSLWRRSAEVLCRCSVKLRECTRQPDRFGADSGLIVSRELLLLSYMVQSCN